MTENRSDQGANRAADLTPATAALERFQRWPEDVRELCRELWSTLGNHNASRTEWLYAREVGAGIAIPAAVTIRQWAREDEWETWSNSELVRTKGKTLHQLQTTWLRALQLSQEVQIDAMLGVYDDHPAAAAVKVKAAESVQRVIAQHGLLALLPSETETTFDEEIEGLSIRQQGAQMRRKIVKEKSGR